MKLKNVRSFSNDIETIYIGLFEKIDSNNKIKLGMNNDVNPMPWYNNATESINHLIKNIINWRKTKLPDTLLTNFLNPTL